MAIFNSIWDDLKYSLRTGNMVTKLVVINFAVFVIMKLAYVLLGGFTLGYPDGLYVKVLHYLCIPASLATLLWQPWSLFSHMFLHDAFWHLAGNMMILLIFGRIVGDLIGDRRVLPLYIMGGLAGGVFFIISALFGFLPSGGYALGASAAVMSLGGAALILAPDYKVQLLALGAVKVKYIVLVLVLLDLTAIAGRYESGGPLAHIAGFVLGCIVIYQLRDGQDWSEKINRVMGKIVGLFKANQSSGQAKGQKRAAGNMRTTYTSFKDKDRKAKSESDQTFQEQLDGILDKIKQSGYESLSQEEKDFLYKASQK